MSLSEPVRTFLALGISVPISFVGGPLIRYVHLHMTGNPDALTALVVLIIIWTAVLTWFTCGLVQARKEFEKVIAQREEEDR